MKRRSLTVLLCLLAIISLASVGFASWVISAGDTEEATGNIQVETVSDQRLLVTVTSGKDEKINLLAPSAAVEGITNPWLYSDNTLGGEDLSATIGFSVTYSDTKNTGTPNATCGAAWNAATQAKIDAAIQAGYIESARLDTSGSKGSYTVTITFTWGSAFEGKNPYVFYNNLNIDDGYYYDGTRKIFKATDDKGNVTYQQETDTIGDGYTKETITHIQNEDKLEITEENLGNANYKFTSWVDDAMNNLKGLYALFAPTTVDQTTTPFTFGIVITATPVVSQGTESNS